MEVQDDGVVVKLQLESHGMAIFRHVGGEVVAASHARDRTSMSH